MPFIPDDKYQKMLQQMQASSYGNAPAQPGMNPFTSGPRPVTSPYQPAQQPPAMPWDAVPGGGQAFENLYSGSKPKPAPKPAAPYGGTPMGPANIPMQARDASSAAYGQTITPNGQMPAGGFANDPAMGAYGGVQRQPQAGEKATGDTAGDPNTLFGFSAMDMIRAGGALLTGANRDGGDWAPFTEVAGQIAGEHENKTRYDKEQKRQAEMDSQQRAQFDAWQKDQAQKESIRGTFNTQLAETQKKLADPSLTPEARAQLQQKLDIMNLGPDVWTQFEVADRNRAAALADQLKLEETRFGHEKTITGMQIAGQGQKALDAESSRFDMLDRKATNAQVSKDRDAMFAVKSQAVPMIDQAISVLDDLAARNVKNGGILDNNMQLKKLFGDPNLGLYQEWQASTLGIAMEKLKQLKGSSSDKELDAIIAQVGGDTVTVGTAKRILTKLRDQQMRDFQYASLRKDFIDQTGGVNAKLGGLDINEWVEKQIGGSSTATPSATSTPAAAAASGLSQQAASAPAPQEAPSVGTKKTVDGVLYIYVGGDPWKPNSWQVAQPGGYRGR